MISSPLLKQFAGYINGRWAPADSGKTTAVFNRATGEKLADVPEMGEAEAVRAVEASAAAMRDTPSLDQRRQWLTQIAERLLAQKKELGRILTQEHGKPLKEGIGEVEYAAGFFRFAANHIDVLQPYPLKEKVRGCQWTVHHRPAGVAGLITPWNFPMALLAKKLSAALATGCASVTKPAGLTPLTSIAFWSLIEDIGLPPGMANLVIGKSGPIGKVLCSHPDVRLISFTGSTEVGQLLMQQVAPHVKRLALELGGNAPFIVFEDADLPAAADALIASKFRAGGQTCVCANRVYVHRGVLDKFVPLVVERTQKLKVGNGLAPETDIGPLINRDAFDKVASHVRDALAKGAKRLAGDDPPRPAQDWAAFYPPTVLVGMKPDMLVCREETFGPVVAITTFEDEAELVRAANSTPFGLAAYVCTRDPQRAERVIPRLQFGHIGLNTGTGPAPEAPFGGMKMSGFGREGGQEGLLEFCELQTVAAA